MLKYGRLISRLGHSGHELAESKEDSWWKRFTSRLVGAGSLYELWINFGEARKLEASGPHHVAYVVRWQWGIAPHASFLEPQTPALLAVTRKFSTCEAAHQEFCSRKNSASSPHKTGLQACIAWTMGFVWYSHLGIAGYIGFLGFLVKV